MIILQILITLAGIYLYVLMGKFALGLTQGNGEFTAIFRFLLWPVVLVIYIAFICIECIGKYILKPIDFMEKLGRNINTYFESKNEKKGE